jgi:hypothetical protein
MIVEEIERMSPVQLKKFTIDLHARYLREATRIADLFIEAEPEADPEYLFSLCRHLIEEVPDAGNTPQRIIGLLLQEYHLAYDTGIELLGHEDRASVTSTTSKKPGDIIEFLPDGSIANCYEITVKPFNQSRVEESFDAIRQYSKQHNCEISEIIVICRKQDSHPKISQSTAERFHFGKIQYQNITYHFVDIFEWIFSQLLRMTSASRINFFKKLHQYINDPNTAEKVKLSFTQWYKEQQSELS